MLVLAVKVLAAFRLKKRSGHNFVKSRSAKLSVSSALGVLNKQLSWCWCYKGKMLRLHVWPEARCVLADNETDVGSDGDIGPSWPLPTPDVWSWCDNERRTKDTANVLQWSPLVSSSPEIIYIPHSWIDFASMWKRFMLRSCENEMFRNFISWVTYHQLFI